MDFCSASNYSPPLYQLSYRRKIPLHHYYLQLDMSLQYTSSSRASAAFLKLDIVVLGCDFLKIQTTKGSGWPSGLRRCVQVAVHFCGRGFESHFWQTILFNLFRNLISIWASHSRVAQWKRAGPITQRSVDRNYALLIIFQYLSKKCKSKCLIFYSLDQFCQDGRVV